MADQRIYTGVFLVNPVLVGDEQQWALSKFHVTYHYAPGDPLFPQGYHEGDWITIKHIGIYDDGEILASRVHLIRRNRQPIEFQRGHSVPLHITWDSGEYPPVESGKRLIDSNLCDDHYHSFDMINDSYYNFGDDTVRAEKYRRIMSRMNTLGMFTYYTSRGSVNES